MRTLILFCFTLLTYTSYAQKMYLNAGIGGVKNSKFLTSSSNSGERGGFGYYGAIGAGIEVSDLQVGAEVSTLPLSYYMPGFSPLDWMGKPIVNKKSPIHIYLARPQVNLLATITKYARLQGVSLGLGVSVGYSVGVGGADVIKDNTISYDAQNSIVGGMHGTLKFAATKKISPYAQVQGLYYHNYRVIALPLSVGVLYRL